MNINKILNFFKKHGKKPAAKNPREKQFEIPETDLNALYACSVQKTPKDFLIKKFDLAGNAVNIAFDEADAELESHDAEAGGLAEAINDVYKMQAAGQEIIFTYYAQQGFIGFNNCSILAQDWLIHKAIAAPCTDAIAVRYKINCDDKDLMSNEQDLMSNMQKLSDDKTGFDIKKICRIFAENKRKYGQSVCIPLVKGADYSNPFNIDAVRPGSYKGMAVIEPVWLAPVLDIENTVNPLSARFYQPSYFRLPNGVMVHYSWCIFNIYGTVSDILKPAYYWGGIPLPQMLYEQVYAAHKTAKEAPMLAQSKRLNYVEVNPNALLFNKGKRDEIKLMSWLRSNFGWLLIKRDQKIGQIDTALTDFDAVTMLGYQIVAAISGVIATRLLETSPKGWQSSGSYEDKQYIKLLKSVQEDDFAPVLDFHYRLLAKSKYNLDRRYIITFDEIDAPGAKEAAEIREINARTASAYIQAGVIAPDEERNILRQDEKSGYNALEEDMPETGPDIFGGEEGAESLNELVNDPNITPSEAAALNGVQVTSMVNIASQVAKNELSRESAIAILQKSFNMSEQEAENIIGSEKLEQQQGSGETQQAPFSQDADEIKEWITIKGNHIPVAEGLSKKEAAANFIERKEQNKYIEKEVNKPAMWGGVKSSELENSKQKQMLNALYNFEAAGNPMGKEDLKKRFPTRSDEEIEKVYNIYKNKNYEIVQPYTPATTEKEKVFNPDYRPYYNGTAAKYKEILEDYEGRTSMLHEGRGYSGYSMSNNAVSAYNMGSKPLSKWNKKNTVNRIEELANEYNIPYDKDKLSKMSFEKIKKDFLKKDGYHHTSKFYNSTDFYKIDIEKLMSDLAE